jgi:hypothetical protein
MHISLDLNVLDQIRRNQAVKKKQLNETCFNLAGQLCRWAGFRTDGIRY